MRIYLDIDGVILTKDLSIPEYGREFLSFVTTNHECYWLTTHCKGGMNNALNHLSTCYPASILEKLAMIKPTDWTVLKTEAMVLDDEFIWLEDCPFESEKMMLNKANKIDSLITVDLKRQNELRSVQEKIESLAGRLKNN